MIVTPDINALYAAVFNRLKADTEGASIRSALGAAAASVIEAKALNANTLPVRPFVALRGGPVTPINLSEWRAYVTWWLYDDPAQSSVRLRSLIPLIGAAYAARTLDSPLNGAVSWIELSAGQQGEDAKLNSLLFCPLTLVISF